MSIEPLSGLMLLAVLCLALLCVAMLAALGIAVVGGFSGAAMALILAGRRRAGGPKPDAFDPARMWQELRNPNPENREHP